MIEPYAENRVRLDENGQKLISYGVSSYGYDVRCAREFKVLQMSILQLLIQKFR